MILVHSGESALILSLAEEGIEYKPEALGIGDVIISERTCIEIKRPSYNPVAKRYEHDFIESIKDKRAFIQTQNMNGAFERKIIIIEGYSKLVENIYHFSREGILSTMAEIACRSGVTFIPTEDMDETIHVILKCIEYDKSDGFHIPINIHPKPKSLYEKQIYLLTGLINIGENKAKHLLDELHTPHEIFKSIVKAEFKTPTRGWVPRLVGIFARLKGYGKKFIKDNQSLLTTRAEKPKPKVNI